VRLFVALDLPDGVRSALAGLIAKLKPKSSGARWVNAENLHVTLKFIGHVEIDRLRPIQEALGTIHSSQVIDLQLRGIGFFPNERHPRVVWCGVAASPNLVALAADIEHALEPLGIESEGRPFTPHLTLARFKTEVGVSDLVRAANEMKSYDFGETHEVNFHLYESLLKPFGAQYNRLASYPILSGSVAKEK
jgi:2'-5' RNA ligase